MSGHSTVRVELGDRSYDVIVGAGILGEAGRRIKPLAKSGQVVIVTDDTVAGLHLKTLQAALGDAGVAYHTIVLPAGERTKEFDELVKLIGAVLDLRPDRDWMLVALGGGVIGDIAGVASSLILRGIGFVQIPTTLLAQVDSSVGGKTAINTRHGKNLVGSFYQPRLVLADTAVLDTLDPRELRAGYAETVKYGLIGDRKFFDWLEANGRGVISGDQDARRHAVVTSVAAKAAIVAQDEREDGRRALLNLGHTFGHALESEIGYGPELLHGEAVAIGCALAFELSAELGLCPRQDVGRVHDHFAATGLPLALGDVDVPLRGPEALLDRMRQDKKARGGRLTFILVRGIGKAFIADDVDERDVTRLLEGATAA